MEVMDINKLFYTADDIAKHLDVSKAYVYKIIKQLNKEPSDDGFITIAGRVNKDYYNKRIYHVNK
jgi:HTH domain.